MALWDYLSYGSLAKYCFFRFCFRFRVCFRVCVLVPVRVQVHLSVPAPVRVRTDFYIYDAIYVRHCNYLFHSRGPCEVAQNLKGLSCERRCAKSADNLSASLLMRDLSTDTVQVYAKLSSLQDSPLKFCLGGYSLHSYSTSNVTDLKFLTVGLFRRGRTSYIQCCAFYIRVLRFCNDFIS